MPPESTAPSPELLYLLSADEEDFQAACADLLPADIAEALNQLPAEAAARIVAALPFHRAVQLLDEPELEGRGEIFAHLQQTQAVPLLEAMSADQQVELFRELGDDARARLIHVLTTPTRDALKMLLRFPATSAGGIMTTEFVAVPAEWTAERVKAYISAVGEAKETVYAIYVHEPATQRLLHVVSLREVALAWEPPYGVALEGPSAMLDQDFRLFGDDYTINGRYNFTDDDRFIPYTPPDDAELRFKVTELIFNSVLRWEFRPGSTLFAVWQHGREGPDANNAFSQSWRRDYRDLFDLHPDNTFLVKVAYWLSR